MKSLTKILFALLVLAGINKACAETQDRHLSGFKAIDVSGPYDVYITQGSAESVRVEAPSDVINRIKTEVSDGVLHIYNKEKWSWGGFNMFGSHHKMVVYVTARMLDHIGVSGSGDVKLRNTISANNLQIRVSGSGDLTGQVNAKNLETGLSGSGDIHLSGHALNSSVSVTGSGDFSGRELQTSTCTVHVSGSGDANVNVTDRLEASVSGSGDIAYSGGVKSVSTSKSGSGSIHRD